MEITSKFAGGCPSMVTMGAGGLAVSAESAVSTGES
jgi:hypothetical protein